MQINVEIGICMRVAVMLLLLLPIDNALAQGIAKNENAAG
jgi:hypothetical protein